MRPFRCQTYHISTVVGTNPDGLNAKAKSSRGSYYVGLTLQYYNVFSMPQNLFVTFYDVKIQKVGDMSKKIEVKV